MGGMKDLFGDTLFEERKPHQLTRASDPSTSYESAARVIPKLRELQRIVYEMHQAHPGGLTDFDLEERCGSHGSTYRTRRAELTEMGLLRDSGRKKLQNGRNRVVWQLVT